jgi:Ser/Thr protein kinase RdoA (MazF antagonist)
MDFYQLDTAAQVERLEQLARQALANWELDAGRLDLIKYRENAVFKLTTSAGTPYALRIHRAGYHSEKALRSELLWMAAVEDYGIHVPRLVPTAGGEPFVSLLTDNPTETRQVDIFEWVNGRQLGSVEEGVADPAAIATTYDTIGSLAAQLHNQATRWQPPAGFTRHAWDAEGLAGEHPFWGQFWQLEQLTGQQRNLIVTARDRVYADLQAYADNPANRDRYSMIHADFVAENLMVDGDLVRLIDFDDAGFGWHLFELATAVYFEMEQDYFPAAWEAMVAGYRRHRSLPDSQLEHMPLFFLARGFTYLGWAHTRQETETARKLAPTLIEKACGLAEQYLDLTAT